MTDWTKLKERSRQALHDFMGRPANFYVNSTGGAFTLISARIHSDDKPVGDLAGTNLSYAETAERPPTAVLLNSQIATLGLTRGCYIIMSTTEGYHVENVEPPDGITTTVDLTPLRPSELSGFEAPVDGG